MCVCLKLHTDPAPVRLRWYPAVGCGDEASPCEWQWANASYFSEKVPYFSFLFIIVRSWKLVPHAPTRGNATRPSGHCDQWHACSQRQGSGSATARADAVSHSRTKRLMDPRLYNVASEELAAVRIEGQFWDQSDPTRHLKQDGERPLKLYSKCMEDCRRVPLSSSGQRGGCPLGLWC